MNARTWLTLFASLALLTGPLGCPSFGSGDDDDDTTTGDDDTHSDDDVSDDDVTQMDEDNDGYTIDEGDCDDGDPDIHPGAVEYCYDERDNDCDGQVDVDDVQSCALNTEEFVVEGDGATLTVPPEAVYGETGLALGIVELAVDPPTGAEFASELYAVTPYGVDFLVPAQLELPYDDTAGDTFQMVMLEDEDDDTWEVVPEARGALPMYIGYPPLVGIFGIVVNTEDSDWDGDGYNEIEGDCDDFDADIHPGADEADNGIDDDCDELIDEDFVSHGDIIVTEFLDYPIQVEDEDQEWLELYNTTATDIDLSGWWVYEAYRGDTFRSTRASWCPPVATPCSPPAPIRRSTATSRRWTTSTCGTTSTASGPRGPSASSCCT